MHSKLWRHHQQQVQADRQIDVALESHVMHFATVKVVGTTATHNTRVNLGLPRRTCSRCPEPLSSLPFGDPLEVLLPSHQSSTAILMLLPSHRHPLRVTLAAQPVLVNLTQFLVQGQWNCNADAVRAGWLAVCRQSFPAEHMGTRVAGQHSGAGSVWVHGE